MSSANSEHKQLPECFGSALRLQVQTNFEALSIFRGAPWITLVITLRKDAPVQLDELVKPLGKTTGFALHCLPGTDIAYLTLRSDPEVLAPLAAMDWDGVATLVEQTLPIAMQRTEDHAWASDLLANSRPKATSRVLLGVIDDGAPFAHWRFREGQRTRVLALWDQNDRPPLEIASPAGLQRFGRVPFDFRWGLEFWRDDSVSGTTRVQGLDAWLARHRHPGGLDEAGCYAEGGFCQRTLTAGVPPGLTRMAGLASHGSHVMDLAAGKMPLSSRLTRAGGPPPSWSAGNDVAGQADIVFVQIPEVGVRDATGQWLASSVLPGIEYIVSCADPTITPKVVVAISYGPTTGPHDGTSLIEQGLRQLCNRYDGRNGRVELTIVLPAGNTWLTQNHVAFESAGPSAVTAWHWQVPPDNPADSAAEVWLPAAVGGAAIDLEPPSFAIGASATVTPFPGGLGWRLHIPPTRPTAGVPQPAAHGNWTIRVSGVSAGTQIHAYLARTDPNFGARTGAKASRFVDPRWEREQAAAAAHRYEAGMFKLGPSLVSRAGTLNGMATDQHPRILVAGGWVLGNGQKASYSSEGPARGNPPRRTGPDGSLPTDETRIATGVPGAGNRGGAVFKLVGTSSAAPQLARHVANGTMPVSPIQAPQWPEAHGGGNLAPP